jgi:hypothetical protein
LLVEGKEELRVLPELLERAGINWPRGNEPVHIKEFEGVDNILEPGAIEAELKASGLEALGILIDADGDPESRWAQVRDRLAKRLPGFPTSLDPSGAIHAIASPRVGVWIMPDNIREGMLETMLLELRRTNVDLEQHVVDATASARARGAAYREVHRAKAELHTWLAWQDPPGLQIHVGVKVGLLTPTDSTRGFVSWVRSLFRI